VIREGSLLSLTEPPILRALLMKRCPECRRDYYDDSLMYCLEDGAALIQGSVPSPDEPQTAVLAESSSAESPTAVFATKLRTLHEPKNSIAILPFANMSADAENEYFCDGLAEELLNALSKIEDLKVAARTSAFSFKGKSSDVGDIGQKLGVKTVLEGSVRKSGNRLRISVQLVNAADGFHLWSERYHREMQDIFDLQDEITLAVVDALKLKLFGEDRSELLKKGTTNAEAFELYMRGRYFWNRRRIDDFGRAIEQFEKAIEIDPSYVLAYTGLADCFIFLGYYEAFPPSVVGPKAEAVLRKAIEMDATQAELQASMAVYKIYFEFDWKGGEEGLLRAIDLNPKLITARYWYAQVLTALGRFDEAIEQCRIALELDPLNLIASGNVARGLYVAHRFDEAIELCQRTLEIDANFYVTHAMLGLIYHEAGKKDDAVRHLRIAASTSDIPFITSLLGFVLAKSGRADEAKQILAAYVEQSKQRYISPIPFCLIYLGLGEIATAMDWLDKAWEERSIQLMWLKTELVFDSVRSEPRFKKVLKLMALPN
jgi:TolB-like protein/Tfp pilus assembly protein PilF